APDLRDSRRGPRRPPPECARSFGCSGNHSRVDIAAARLAPAPAPSRTAVRQEHLLAGFFVGLLKVFPPFRDLGIDLTAVTSQHEEIIGGAKTRMRENTVGPAPRASQKTRLQRPDVLHVRAEAPRNGQFLGLHMNHMVHRLEKRRERVESLVLCLLPC